MLVCRADVFSLPCKILVLLPLRVTRPLFTHSHRSVINILHGRLKVPDKAGNLGIACTRLLLEALEHLLSAAG